MFYKKNALKKGSNPSIPPTAMGNLAAQTVTIALSVRQSEVEPLNSKPWIRERERTSLLFPRMAGSLEIIRKRNTSVDGRVRLRHEGTNQFSGGVFIY